MIELKETRREDVIYLVNELEDFDKDRAIRFGLKRAVNIFRVKGRSNLRERLLHDGKQTNHLMNSFTTRVKRNKLGALAGFDRPGGNHAHLVDQGTVRRYSRKGYRGVMPANRFWEDTKKTEEPKAMRAVYEGVQEAVKRINERRD